MSNLTVIDLDLRGKACPGPVVETRKAFLSLDEEAMEVMLTVQLDNQAACLNVTRFAESQNFMVSQDTGADGTFILTITRGFNCELPPSESPVSATPDHYIECPQKTVISNRAIWNNCCSWCKDNTDQSIKSNKQLFDNRI